MYLLEKFSQNYATDMYNTLNRIYVEKKCRTIEDIKKLLENKGINDRTGRTAFRVFLNYIEVKELLDEDLIIKFRKKIKLSISTNIDNFIPTEKQINESLSIIENIYPNFSIFYKLILESGCRPSELKEFIRSFDKTKVEEYDKIIVYRNMYFRNSKNSFYLFFTKKTYDEFLKLDKNSIKIDFEKFIDKMGRKKEIINLKYLRKYQFTQMVKVGVSLEIANFIQGRSSKDVGFNHYLAKKEISVREYGKIIL